MRKSLRVRRVEEMDKHTVRTEAETEFPVPAAAGVLAEKTCGEPWRRSLCFLASHSASRVKAT